MIEPVVFSAFGGQKNVYWQRHDWERASLCSNPRMIFLVVFCVSLRKNYSSNILKLASVSVLLHSANPRKNLPATVFGAAAWHFPLASPVGPPTLFNSNTSSIIFQKFIHNKQSLVHKIIFHNLVVKFWKVKYFHKVFSFPTQKCSHIFFKISHNSAKTALPNTVHKLYSMKITCKFRWQNGTFLGPCEEENLTWHSPFTQTFSSDEILFKWHLHCFHVSRD